MYALVQKITFRGINTILLKVQVNIANGLPTITIVDLNAEATISQTTTAEAQAYRVMLLA